jgi:4-diphosphocytidyl-2-C-methyl-D-erythritol kinase
MANSLERPVFEKYPLLGEMKYWLLRQPEVHAALMSGSGSTMLAVMRKEALGEELEARARARYGESSWTFIGKTL